MSTMSDILFFHGFAASPESLSTAVQLLQKNGHRVSVPQMLSFSFTGENYFQPDQWLAEAEQVTAEYATTVTGDFSLAGHSLGGAICGHLLHLDHGQTFANRIEKCAFLATPAGIDDGFLRYWREESSKNIGWPFGLQVHMLSFLRAIDDTFTGITVPSLVLHGEQDRHIPSSASACLCRSLGEYCLDCVTHPLADHFFPEKTGTGPDFLLQKMVDFFNGSPTRKASCD